ncbi:HEAT repeat-containing PBS lyase [Nostoc commune NIES-4072]|uniref:HEAT repeat-containing PBS lyase n=1 Tax=Nostoc commune NIES-4072 TaxID=2005467 RepID=A0A2R5FTZ2_NOSCO|nr:HEAT repeat domain-containing protein [Nostoc commune]BBD68068.1 HEAT repeat-containing PBS lyase [Nostoc commune HK-02]GBG20938.1 HEAT repeat-containing PBS lyase [Nostoc commune NIES-4072]
MNPSLENIKDLSVTVDNADGGSLTVEQALANLESADLGLRFYAAWWLGRFRINEPAAVTALIKALEDEADRTPEGGYPLRRNAARALGKLGDRQAVSPLIKCLDCSDFYVREAAVQSLEMLGDPVCIPALIKLLAVGLQGEQLISQPDLSQPYDAILEALGTLRATEFAPLVKAFLEHPIELVQYSAARAMYQLTQEPVYGERLVKALAGEKLQLRRAVLADLGAIGYLPAADAIAQTLAENSLKLISLKGLLEHQVNHITPSTFSEGAIKVINLMDSLL